MRLEQSRYENAWKQERTIRRDTAERRGPSQEIAMDMKAVKSSNIAEIGYDPKTNTLAVKFNGNGRTYHYPNVKQDVFDKFSKAESIGGHFAEHIRPKFKGERQEEKKAAK
ncbi:MAG: KTSC domain-containing protein [Egibacteraceae bacterium]